MPVRRRVVGRSPDGRLLFAISGDDLPWKHDVHREAYFTVSKDGRAKYAVARSRPEGFDRGRRPYAYWRAGVVLDGKPISLGDEHMIAQEGIEVCQIYESERLATLQSPAKEKKIDHSRG